MNEDAPRPGEIDLETGVAAPVAEPAAEPEVTHPSVNMPLDDAEVTQTDPPVADPPAEPEPPKHRGAVGELMTLRRENQQLQERLQQISADPVLSRLTPELRQAAAEGRLIVKPPEMDAAAEQARLTAVAERLGLYKYDANQQLQPDLGKAKEAAALIREMAGEVVAPLQQTVLSGVAGQNYQKAIAHAEANGYDVETVKEVFGAMGPEALASARMAEAAWTQAVGIMVQRGKPAGKGYVPAGQPPAAAPVKPPAAVVVEPSGRRGNAQNAITLSPALAAVYKNHGVDPNKSFSTTLKPDTNLSGIELE